MTLHHIPKFEKANNIKINVYTDKKIPLHISKQSNDEVINLFYFNNHYSLISNFSRFVGEHKYCCERCLKTYQDKTAYDRHIEICKELNENGSLVTTCKEGTKTIFTNYKAQKNYQLFYMPILKVL